MKTSDLLHVAIRARDPEKLAFFYADLFDGCFFLHPVMTGLGIMIVKINRPEALFDGLVEFWPWEIEWDGAAQGFRRVAPRPSPQTYGHLAVKVPMTAAQIVAELQQRGIAHRMEPRGPGLDIPVIDDPEGNFIELFPNIDHMAVPPEALCDRANAAAAIAAIKQRYAAATAHLPASHVHPLMTPPR